MDDATAEPIIQLTCEIALAIWRTKKRIIAWQEDGVPSGCEAKYDAYCDGEEWDDEEPKQALLREIGSRTGDDPLWVEESKLSDLYWDLFDGAEPKRTKDEILQLGREVGIQILDWMENLGAIDWIAFVPMERRFDGFPAYTDFGPFQIVNAGADCRDLDEILNKFAVLLATKCCVSFHPTSEVSEAPYGDNAKALAEKTNWYIPGRALLALRLQRGERAPNAAVLRRLLKSYLPLIRLCQIACEPMQETLPEESSLQNLMPDRSSRMPAGFTQVPPIALAMNRLTGGHACLMQLEEWRERSERYAKKWSERSGRDIPEWRESYEISQMVTEAFFLKAEPANLSLQTFDTDYGEWYHYETFLKSWNDIAQPVVSLRKARLSEKRQGKALNRFRETIDGAIELVARCRYEPSILLHSSVIATETLLNPFSDTSNLSERFALFVASLTQTDPKRRREKYYVARDLYKLRSEAVHSSGRTRRKQSGELSSKDAFEVFVDCLKSLVKWVQGRVDRNETLDENAFKDFYLETLFSDPT